jgi:hypothetical protein
VKKRVATMPDYRKLADEVRALIASGAFHAPDAIEDLLQLAASYEGLANQHSTAHHRSGTNVTSPPVPPRSADETLLEHWERHTRA